MQIAFSRYRRSLGPPSSRGPSRLSRRRGLAPLELVISLFFLLLMMALIINFGTVSSWNVRGMVAARFGAWRAVGLRGGQKYPNPLNWRVDGATMGQAPSQPINPNVLNPVWNQGDLTQAALRGQPLAQFITDPNTGRQFGMGNQQYMELGNSTSIGVADLTRKLPLLPKMRQMHVQPKHPLFDPLWRFEDMAGKSVDANGYPWSMRNNGDWRLYKWYLLEASQLPDGAVQEKYGQYQMADQMIKQSPGQAALTVLDRDDEFMAWGQVPPPDFYPTVGGCEMNPQMVEMNLISGRGGLISRIEGPRGGGRGGVPDAVVSAFIRLYQQQLQMAQQQQPPDPQVTGPLQQKIQELQKFQATLF
ncbi:MAG: hypothetical protein JSS02_16740 [Planctomycetes bacterium]|nr:hypothetical protein [Planctomycetota bacterium]